MELLLNRPVGQGGRILLPNGLSLLPGSLFDFQIMPCPLPGICSSQCQTLVKRKGTIYSKVIQTYSNDLMSLLKIPKSLKTPTNTQSFLPPLPSPRQSGVLPSNLCSVGRPPAVPSTVSCVAGISSSQSKPVWHFLLAPSKSPFTPFLPAASLLHSSKLLRESSASLLHLAFQLPKGVGKLPFGAKGAPKPHGCPSRQSCGVPTLMAAVPGFKSWL